MKTTIELAREAGFKHDTKGIIWTEDRDGDCTEELKAFEALVRADEREETNRRANASWTLMCEKMVAAEREACAKVCESIDLDGYPTIEQQQCAAAIRARGETK